MFRNIAMMCLVPFLSCFARLFFLNVCNLVTDYYFENYQRILIYFEKVSWSFDYQKDHIAQVSLP